MSSQPQPQRRPTGCRFGCVFVVCVAIVIAGAIVWGGISTYRGAYQMTSPGPQTFTPIIEGGASEVDAKLQVAQEDLAKGNSPEVHLTADQLNAWFLGNPRNHDL